MSARKFLESFLKPQGYIALWRGGGGGGVAPTHNKWGCAILTKIVVPKNPGTYLKLRPKKSGNLSARLSFLLCEKIYHPDRDINSTFEFYLFYQRILLFNFCFTMFVQRVLNFLQLLSV